MGLRKVPLDGHGPVGLPVSGLDPAHLRERLAHAVFGLTFDLPYALAAQSHAVPGLLQRQRRKAVEAKPVTDHGLLLVRQLIEGIAEGQPRAAQSTLRRPWNPSCTGS